MLEVIIEDLLSDSELNKENRSLKKKKHNIEKHLHKEVSSKGEQMTRRYALHILYLAIEESLDAVHIFILKNVSYSLCRPQSS